MDANIGQRAPRAGAGLAILLTGSVLLGLSIGRYSAPLAAWIGPVLILYYARQHRNIRGLLALLVAALLYVFIAFGSFFPPALAAMIVVLNACLMTLPYLADQLMSQRLRGFRSTLVFPLAATALEFFYIRTNPVGTWGGMGFTQYGNLPLMQLASVTGVTGITFVMAWFASVTNWAWQNRARAGQLRAGLVTFGAVVAAVFVFGAARLNLAPNAPTLRVAGITAQSLDVLGGRLSTMTDKTAIQKQVLAHWDAYFAETVREAQAGAKVVLWSEVAGVVSPEWGVDEAAQVARAQDVARQNGIHLGLSLFVRPAVASEPFGNKMLLIGPNGSILFEHVKYGASVMEPGRLVGDGILRSASTPFGIISAVICYDLDFPAVAQQAGQLGTGLLLVPSKDWYEIDPVHSHMAVFRAIENGMSVVRQVDAGLSIAVDAYGRVLARTDYFGSTDHTMIAQVPIGHVATFYNLAGRWFDALCLAVFVILVIVVIAGARAERRTAARGA